MEHAPCLSPTSVRPNRLISGQGKWKVHTKYTIKLKFSPLWINEVYHCLTGIEAKPFFFRIKALEYWNQDFFALFWSVHLSTSHPQGWEWWTSHTLMRNVWKDKKGAIIIIPRKCMISVSEWKLHSASLIIVYLLWEQHEDQHSAANGLMLAFQETLSSAVLGFYSSSQLFITVH